MSESTDSHRAADPAGLGHRQRWELFETLCRGRIRARDAAWADRLSPRCFHRAKADQLTVAADGRITGTLTLTQPPDLPALQGLRGANKDATSIPRRNR